MHATDFPTDGENAMAFIPAPVFTCRVALNYLSTEGRNAVNVLYTRPSAADPTTLTAVAEAVRDWFDDHLSESMSGQWSLVSVEARDVTVEDGYVVVLTDGLPIAGQVAGAVSPAQVSTVITWRTGLAGRSQRGRFYVVGLAEAAVEQSDISPGLRTALIATGGELIDTLTALDAPLVIASYEHNGLPRAIAQTTPVISADNNGKIATQRRRLN